MKMLDKKIEGYLQAKEQIETVSRLLSNEKEKKDKLSKEIIAVLRSKELRSIKHGDKRISLIEKKDVKVFDEQAVIQDLKKHRVGNMTKIKLDTVKFKKFARGYYTERDELFDGSEYTITDYLQVKK